MVKRQIKLKNAIFTINSILIWAAIGALSYLLFITLTNSNVNTSFGQNQLFIIGFIVLLLLFRYISKIKLGDWLEIEFWEKAEQSMNKTYTLLDNVKTMVTSAAFAATATTVTSDIDAAKLELDEVKSVIETMKLYAKQRLK
jgi:hypothetical protein